MATDSKHHRYRDAGQAANVNNVERFGQPVRSLFTSTKILTLHKETEIFDDAGNVVYRSWTHFPSLHDRTEITDAAGNFVAHLERKLFTLHERRYVDMADGRSFELSNELWHIVRDVTNIEGLGWQLQGNILALNFELYDAAGRIIAVIGQKLLSIHDKYCMDIYQPEFEHEVVAILIGLQHMIQDREAASSASSSASSSN